MLTLKELTERIETVKSLYPHDAKELSDALGLLSLALDGLYESTTKSVHELMEKRRPGECQTVLLFQQDVIDLQEKVDEYSDALLDEKEEAEDIDEMVTDEEVEKRQLPDYAKYQVDSAVPHSLNDDYTYTKACGFTINGNYYDAKNMRDILVQTCGILAETDLQKMDSLVDDPTMKGRKVMDSLKASIDVHVALLQAQQALEQKIDEQALTFDMVFDQAPIGIAISHSRDPKRSDKNNIKINSAFEQITGRTKEELIDSGWAKITYPDDLDEDIERFNKLQSGEIKSYSMEKRYVKPDGSVVWVYMVVAAFAPNDENKINHMCLIQDITIQKAAKLLDADLSKAITSDIISMSHKLGHCTIAEGVEYESQLQYLKEHNCDRIQGYLFSKPLNEEDALEFLKSKNKNDCQSNDSRD